MQQEALDWTVVGAIGSSVTSACPSDPALGGYQIVSYGGYFQRVFDSLPSHNIIYFRMRFGVIDDWRSGDTINVFFDSTSINPGDLGYDRAYFSSNLCGNSVYKDDDSIFMIGKVFHTASSLTFKVKSNILSAANQNSAHFNIRKISLLFANKTSGETEGNCIHASYTADKDCGCGQGYYPNPSNPSQCFACNAACTDCFGPSANECYACSASGYSWDGTKCFKCAANCIDCFGPGANQCLKCSSTYWHNPDFTCTSTCSSPNQVTIGEIKICKNPCSGATPFELYDSACVATCDSPLVTRTTNFGSYCDWPCASSTDYLYWNNSCTSSCNSPYVVVAQVGGGNTCQLPCSTNNYLYPNSSCISTCSQPEFTVRSQSSVLYCDYTCDYASGQYLNWTGLCVSSCALPSYARTVNNSVKYCDACQPGYFLYSNNGSCLATCSSPFSSRTVNGSSFCDLPCSANLFTYQNGSCKTTCDFPYSSVTTSDYKFCNKPCSNSLDFVHQNGTCSSTCYSPAIQTTWESILICSKPCPGSSDFYYSWNSTCHSPCSSPAVQSTWESIPVCSKPCPGSSDYYYSWNSTCHSSCPYRIGQDPDYGINLCLPPCVNPSDYFYPENSTCSAYCSTPSHVATTSPFNICQSSSNATSPGGPLDGTPGSLTNMSIQYASISNALSTYSTPAMALLSSSNFGAFGLRGFVKMLPYLRYMEIDYPVRLQEMLDNLNSTYVSFSFGIPMPSSLQNEFPKSSSLPGKFGFYDLHSSFVVNYWSTMTSLIILLLLISALLTLHLITKKSRPTLNEVINRLKLIAKWNFFLMIFCANIDGIILPTSLEFRTLSIHSFPAAFSSMLCIFMNIMLVLVFCTMIRIFIDLRKDSRLISPEKNLETRRKWREFQLFFAGSKDTSLICQIFLLPYLLRMCLFYIVVSYSFRYPMLQTTIMIFMGLGMLYYMIFKSPFVSKIVLFQHVTDEILLLGVNSCIMGLAILDSYGIQNTSLRPQLGDMVIVINIMANVSANFYLVCYFVSGIKSAISETRKHKAKGLLNWLLVFLSPYESGGMDMKFDPGENQQQMRLPIRSRKTAKISPSLLSLNQTSQRKGSSDSSGGTQTSTVILSNFNLDGGRSLTNVYLNNKYTKSGIETADPKMMKGSSGFSKEIEKRRMSSFSKKLNSGDISIDQEIVLGPISDSKQFKDVETVNSGGIPEPEKFDSFISIISPKSASGTKSPGDNNSLLSNPWDQSEPIRPRSKLRSALQRFNETKSKTKYGEDAKLDLTEVKDEFTGKSRIIARNYFF